MTLKKAKLGGSGKISSCRGFGGRRQRQISGAQGIF